MSIIPFVQPYTAPDGTTRRPLCERVPECVPPLHVGGVCVLDGVSKEVDTASAALWRVAVEDWLLSQYTDRAFVWITNLGVNVSGLPVAPGMLGTRLFEFSKGGPSALNAAAHAVADALGIAH